LADLANLCETEPDEALKFIKSRSNVIESTEDLNLLYFIKYCEGLAYGSKGFLKIWQEKLNCEDLINKDMDYFLKELGLKDDDLDNLERSLQIVKEIYDFDPEFLSTIGPEKIEIGGISINYSIAQGKIDIIASVLERCKPGKVQEILGMTKLDYFGINRIKFKKSYSNTVKLEIFLNIYFSVPSIVKSVLIIDYSYNPSFSEHKYLECMLFRRTFDDLGPNDSLKVLERLDGVLCLFPNQTYSYIDLEEEISELKIKMSEQTKAIKNLEKLIGEIPTVSEIEWNTFGVKVQQDNQIVGLNLYKKGLTSLPNTIGNLTSLKELYLENNQLTSLPDTIGNLTSLKELQLGSNPLTSLPENVKKALKKLKKQGCKISY